MAVVGQRDVHAATLHVRADAALEAVLRRGDLRGDRLGAGALATKRVDEHRGAIGGDTAPWDRGGAVFGDRRGGNSHGRDRFVQTVNSSM